MIVTVAVRGTGAEMAAVCTLQWAERNRTEWERARIATWSSRVSARCAGGGTEDRPYVVEAGEPRSLLGTRWQPAACLQCTGGPFARWHRRECRERARGELGRVEARPLCESSEGCPAEIPAEGSACTEDRHCNYCAMPGIPRMVRCSAGAWVTIGPNLPCAYTIDPVR